MRPRFLLILFVLSLQLNAAPGLYAVKYGIRADSTALRSYRIAATDSLLGKPFAGRQVLYRIESARGFHDRTPDFYLLLGLCIILGAIRFTDPRYFGMLLRAARNSGGIRGGLREGIQGAVLSNFLMNLLFSVVAGAYLFYVVRGFGHPSSRYMRYGNPGLLAVCIGGMLAIYLVKYTVIRFSGWAFRISAITSQYNFNVFLFNKIIGIVLLPFVVLLAFSDPAYTYSLVFISLLITCSLFCLRYVRSWPVFSSFFDKSRFHFFTYLCASEILPMAIIVKLLLRLAA